jgi:hypothetical protein
MTALTKAATLAAASLADVEAKIDQAEARGRVAFRELALLVAEVYHLELWRQATVPTGAVGEKEERLHVPRPCKSFVEWCTVCREKKKDWGYQLVAAAAYSAIAENEAQARELKGLSEDQARRVVDKATGGGTKATTAAELRRARAEIEAMSPAEIVSRSRRAGEAAGRELERFEAEAWLKDVGRWAKKGRTLFRRQVGTEDAEPLIDQLEQLARDVAA